MSVQQEILETLKYTLSHMTGLSGSASPPDTYLITVDRYGEQMDRPPVSETLSYEEALEFTANFRNWLRDMSRELRDKSLDDAAISMQKPSGFASRFQLFTTPLAFAQWYSQPANDEFDSYIPTYINEGFPILQVSLFKDRA